MKKFILLLVALFILVSVLYLEMPVLAYGFTKIGYILLLITIVIMFFYLKLEINPVTHKTKILKLPPKVFSYIIAILIVYIFVVPFLTSSKMFRTKEFQSLIGKVENGNSIEKQIAPISLNEIRVVDKPLAYLLGEKVLGSQPALGSQVELGEFCIQKVQNKLYWVAPLLHSGFFKWLNNKNGSAGYVMVSATNERDVKLVQQNNGKNIFIKYQSGAYFNQNIKRHIYFNGYTNSGLTDFSFEIDDNGTPHWVVTQYKKTIGFAGNDATGVVVVNAQTGSIKNYTIKNAPNWVDRVQPIDFIENQLNDWGELINGYWNFSNQNKLKITEGLTLVYGKNNNSYWYTGLTSVGKDESAVGFVLVDTRTKQTTFYKQSGATEYAAQSSAEGKVQEKQYTASLPIPYNINNIPTYVMTLKDNGGLVKMYAMVAISDYTIVGVGNNMRETLTSFKSIYNSSGSKIDTKSQSLQQATTAIVTRIQSDVKNGNSFYYFKINNSPIIFVGSSQISNQLPITNVGDQVKITFDLDNEKITDVTSFENLSLK